MVIRTENVTVEDARLVRLEAYIYVRVSSQAYQQL